MNYSTIDLDSGLQDRPIAEYELHLVPCKIGTTGPTKEMASGFRRDADEPKQESEGSVTYLRGRKIIGKAVFPQKDRYTVVALEPCETTNNTSLDHKKAAEISHIYNYEREGNEQRMHEEMDKFHEYLELSDLIHQS
ncbi:LAFA_0G03312g1_1 [Lachancea sp. 'fantastica']|nr:LAFA_0G03312g1_1 [Lachancea sp. 'fantastica']